MSHFFAYLYRLRFIRRWSLMRNTEPENVAEHTFYVALLTHALCTIGREVFGKDPDVGRAVTLALFHDVAEVMTGDIPTPVKHHDDAILRGMRELEGVATAQLLAMVPANLRASYRPLIEPDGGDREALRWVRAADKLAAYLKCAAEVASGNREFVVAKRQIEQTIRGLELPEVEYFLTRFAPSFERTLDEISE
jgi:5'-deoxynucleotidase